jgi:hypothetical protein
MAQSNEDRETQVERLFAAGHAVIHLQHRRGDPNRHRIFNFEDLKIYPYQPPNSAEIRYRAEPIKHGVLVFEPDQNNIRHAYALDTPRNRKLIALMFYDNDFFVVRRLTQNGVDLGIAKELKTLADQLKAEELNKKRTGGVMIEHAAPAPVEAVDVPAPIPAPAVLPPTKVFIDAVIEDVHASNPEIITFLSKRKPKNWRTSPEYEELMGDKIREAFARNGIPLPGAKEEMPKQTIPGPAPVPEPPAEVGEKVPADAVPNLAEQI